ACSRSRAILHAIAIEFAHATANKTPHLAGLPYILNMVSPMEKQQAIELIRGYPFNNSAGLLVERLMPSARLIVCDDQGGRNGASPRSYLGGLPSLPADAVWPVWDRKDFLSGQIARLEQQFKANPRATGLRDI